MKKIPFLLLLVLIINSCTEIAKNHNNTVAKEIETPDLPKEDAYLVVLGIAQDAGYPQANCKKDCCKNVWAERSLRKMVSCLGLVDPVEKKSFLFDATPDFKDQIEILQKEHQSELANIFLTHAHIGHYTGLMNLGKEAMGAKEIPVYAMPRMRDFLAKNGPWSQLVDLKNISLKELNNNTTISFFDKKIKITPLLVPHRDEFSETVGYHIAGKNRTAIFIPDIDKWEKWDSDILLLIRSVDYAFLDGSFFENGEIPGRDMSLIPHPFMEESMELFKDLSAEDKAKVHFIHFNHTNPVLQKGSAARKEVMENGFQIAEEGSVFML